MSNDVCGYVLPCPDPGSRAILESYISASPIGVGKISSKELFNYPLSLVPDLNTFVFLIGDRPGHPNATYLTDYNEYDPLGSEVGFPVGARDRVSILLGVLRDISLICKSETLVVSISDSSQIKKVKRISFSEMFDVVFDDFDECQGPPDTLYEVQCVVRK